MGLLDSKYRILDSIVTVEGRRQLARGRMDIRFATFTDQDAFYEGDTVSGTTDTKSRPHFEAYSKPQDTIAFESDDVGNLLQYKGSRYDVISGHVRVPSGSSYLAFPSQSERRSAQLGLLTSSIDNFAALRALGTIDPLVDEPTFALATNDVKFQIVDGMLGKRQGIDIASIDDVEGIFQDKRLSHVKNFKYLPPRNTATPEEPNGSMLGDYPRLDQGNTLSFTQLMNELSDAQRVVVDFTENSRDGNMFGQVFELRDDTMKKLDVIDFGEFVDPSVDSGSRHVFFVGRMFVDSRGTHTFVNMFTLVFS